LSPARYVPAETFCAASGVSGVSGASTALNDFLYPLAGLLSPVLERLLDLVAHSVRPHLRHAPPLAELRLDAATVLLHSSIHLIAPATSKPNDLPTSLPELAKESAPSLAKLADRPVPRNRAATLEPASAATHPRQLALGARAARPWPDRAQQAVTSLERHANWNQHRTLCNADHLRGERLAALGLRADALIG
jgi:hypothetical protein